MSNEEDKIFFRNYSIVLGILAGMIIIFLIAARIIGLGHEQTRAMNGGQSDQVAKATQPVGQSRMEGEAAPNQQPSPGSRQTSQASSQEASSSQQASTEQASTGSGDGNGGGQKSGKEVFNGLCVSCHGAGLPGVPQFGNKQDWAPRIAKGKDTLYQHALNGFSSGGPLAMPPKGGNPALSDAEVESAVDYMVANSQ